MTPENGMVFEVVDSCAPADATGAPYGCAQKALIFTKRELLVLERIRDAGERARELKAVLGGASGCAMRSEKDRSAMEDELAQLRRLRFDLEEERRAASEERMHLLGHI